MLPFGGGCTSIRHSTGTAVAVSPTETLHFRLFYCEIAEECHSYSYFVHTHQKSCCRSQEVISSPGVGSFPTSSTYCRETGDRRVCDSWRDFLQLSDPGASVRVRRFLYTEEQGIHASIRVRACLLYTYMYLCNPSIIAIKSRHASQAIQIHPFPQQRNTTGPGR